MRACVRACVRVWASGCVHMLVYVVINLFLAIIVICLNILYIYMSYVELPYV